MPLSRGVLSSGITNPPVLILAARLVGERAADRDLGLQFWRGVIDPLEGWLSYLLENRTLAGSPLPLSVHPWETGWDNSPRWDFLAAAGLRPRQPYARLDTRAVNASERPTTKDYDSFVALMEILDDADYRLSEYAARTPFLVRDVLLDALTVRAAEDLAHMAHELGRPPLLSPAAVEDLRRAFREVHVGAGGWWDLDAVAGKPIRVATPAGLAALAGVLATPAEARALLDDYLRLCPGLQRLPTTVPGPAFAPELYWRGPVWVNVNWLAVDGLRRAGLAAEAEALRRETVKLVRAGGFAEYFDPRDGSPRGIADFSWTAALTLDLLGPG